VLCSDGMWSAVEDHDISDLAAQCDVTILSQRLLDLAMERDSDDNISVITIHVQQLGAPVENGRRGLNLGRLFKRRSSSDSNNSG
jgi:serine/threonine protein phosphatase PrpC